MDSVGYCSYQGRTSMSNWITVEDSLKGRALAVERERERIIKLLEEEISRVSNPMLVDREYLDGLEVAIALIKGETNE